MKSVDQEVFFQILYLLTIVYNQEYYLRLLFLGKETVQKNKKGTECLK